MVLSEDRWDWQSGLAAWMPVAAVAVAVDAFSWPLDPGSALHVVGIKLSIWWLLLLACRTWSRALDVVRTLVQGRGGPRARFLEELATGVASFGAFALAIQVWVVWPSRLGARPLVAYGPLLLALIAAPFAVRAIRTAAQLGGRLLAHRRRVAYVVSAALIVIAARAWTVTTGGYTRRYLAAHLLSAVALLAGSYLLVKSTARPAAVATGRRPRLVAGLSLLAALAILAVRPGEGTRQVVLADTLMRAAFATLPTLDGDRDGHGRALSPWSGVDCDDSNAAVHPLAAEVIGNGIDENCFGGDLARPHPELAPAPAPPAPDRDTGQRRSILLLVLDAFRFERQTELGFDPADAPRLAAIAGQSSSFSRLRMCSSFTATSIGFLLRGAGTRDQPTDIVTHLRDAGYHTIHHSEAWASKPSPGFLEHGGGGVDGKLRFADQAIVDQLVARIARGLPDPFFLYVHLLDLHYPHRPIPPCRTSDPPRQRYRCLLRRIDGNVGRLIDALERANRLDDTVVAILGDHGEELGERGAVAHASSIYEEVLRVPLLLRIPGRPPGRSDLPLSCFDLLPTILQAARQPAPPWLLGRRQLDPAGPTPSTQWAAVDYKEVSLRAVIHDELKLIHDLNTSQATLYDLRADPDERRPIHRGDDPRARALFPAMDAWISLLNRR